MSKISSEAVLATPMGDNDTEATTIREYLATLLLAVWQQRDGFYGKKPFGNSGWECDVYAALAKAGHIEATFDGDGCLIELTDEQERKADKLIDDAIRSLGNAQAVTHG